MGVMWNIEMLNNESCGIRSISRILKISKGKVLKTGSMRKGLGSVKLMIDYVEKAGQNSFKVKLTTAARAAMVFTKYSIEDNAVFSVNVIGKKGGGLLYRIESSDAEISGKKFKAYISDDDTYTVNWKDWYYIFKDADR
jgi:hypothetical protein